VSDPAVLDTTEEREFRELYATELRKKRVARSINPHFGIDELADELERVRHQQLVTPGRRGEQIKREELGEEYLR
jgi:hypothetical protein